MQKHLIFLFLLTLANISFAQNYSFEEPDVPTDWVASGSDALSVSAEHYKDGIQSLCWTTNGNNTLTVTFPSFLTSTSNGARLQIYSSVANNDVLEVEFYSSYNQLRRKAVYLLNYKGWRDFNRQYAEYSTPNSSQDIAAVKFTLKPASSGVRKICFDNVDFNAAVNADRVIGNQWAQDYTYFAGNTEPVTINNFTRDIPVTSATSQELSDLNTLRNALKRTPAYYTQLAADTRTYVDGLNLQRNLDGSINGPVLDNRPEALTTAAMDDISKKVEVLAADYLRNTANVTAKTRFANYLDYLFDQGIAEGCSFGIRSNDYTPSRNIPARFLNAIDACTPEQKEQLLKFVRWFSFYGNMYYAEGQYKTNLNSDIMYLYLPHIMAAAAFTPDNDTAVRELKAVKRFIERNTEYVPGGSDILKPDGTGFHHGTHYNNYMYSYQTWVDGMNYLKGTQFRVSTEAYSRMKKAVISIYRMATNNTDENRFFANSLAGRKPFSSGINLFFTKTLFQNLVSIGGDCMGTAIDEELAVAYNFFYKTNYYSVPAVSQDGFYQFNYSPAAVYRKNNWVVTMRAPTTKFWGAEIYDKANRFGRYQSHGTLEVMYEGATPAYSGFPVNGTGGGWDWNMPQGATTVQYSTWQSLMPYRSATGRFDQYTKTKNLAGALAWKDCGTFACDFDQIDTWNGQAFTPTNLVFKKSMFAFDGVIISLGSNIGTSGTYNNAWFTATNLFQNIVSDVSTDFVVNGSIVTAPYSATLTSTADNWLVTPAGTGYFIPKGTNDIQVKLNTQTTPKSDGSDYASPLTSAMVAKAYIDHGVKTTGKSYVFVVAPGVTSSAMQTLAAQMQNNGGTIYKINSQTSTLHSVTHLPTQTNAYAFFGTTNNLAFGKIKSCSSALLVMQREEIPNQKMTFAVSNPNLNPVYDAVYGWVSSPASVSITLVGEWKADAMVEGVTFSTPSNGETTVTFNLKEGEPLYFTAVNVNTTAIEQPKTKTSFTYNKQENHLIVKFNGVDEKLGKQITIYSVDGKQLKTVMVSAENRQVNIDTSGLGKGVKIAVVSSGANGKENFKWIN